MSKALKDLIKFLNREIDLKKSNLNTYKNTKKIFRKKVESLPKGDPGKKQGSTLSKKLFLEGMQFKLGKSIDKDIIKKMEIDIVGGTKALKKVKKDRKKLGVRFIKIRGKVVPIKVKK